MKIRLGTASAALTLVLVVLVLGVVTTQSAQAQTFTVLHNFTGPYDGADPWAGLVRDTAGNLYGTTGSGGSSGYGTVFKVDKTGTETVLYSFCSVAGCTDGAGPLAGVIMDTAGTLYGTASGGGFYRDGVVFKVDTSGKERVLHHFHGVPDGGSPYAGLVRDAKGNFYGTTFQGGSSGGYGTVFKLSTKGKETVLHRFTGGWGGANPSYASLLMDKYGNFYGTTTNGGDLNCNSGQGCGVVYKMSKSGTLTVLHRFHGGVMDGAFPFAGVIMDATGNLYGDTEEGGASSLGTVYELNKKGTLTLLHSFAGSDGEYPIGGVIRDAKGNFYGTAYGGGSGGYGTVWQITK